MNATNAVELVPFSGLESRRELWAELASRSGNIFATWEWARAWWRHFGRDGEARFIECREDGRPFAILPLYVAKRGPLRTLRLLGHGPGDVLGPICDPADAALAGHALRQALSARGKPKLLLAERLPGGAMSLALGGRVLAREANPRLDIGGRTWEEYVASRSRNVKEKLRRTTRKLERAYEVSYRLCEGTASLEADLDTLIRLHRDRWDGETNFGRESIIAFHRDLGKTLLERGWLRFWTMEADGEAVAAWYGFRFGGTESFYQSGRDRSFDRYSVGFLMLMQTIKSAFGDSLERYAFLRGDEPYKDRFATADDGLQTQVLGRGPFAATLARTASLTASSPRLRKLMANAMR